MKIVLGELLLGTPARLCDPSEELCVTNYWGDTLGFSDGAARLPAPHHHDSERHWFFVVSVGEVP